MFSSLSSFIEPSSWSLSSWRAVSRSYQVFMFVVSNDYRFVNVNVLAGLMSGVQRYKIMTAVQPHKVLIVDDSKTMCAYLVQLLSSDPRLNVVGYALDVFEAKQMIQRSNPDVIMLDVDMPQADGLTFLRKVMKTRPIPIVMVSTRSDGGSTATLDALEAGAVDFVLKRNLEGKSDIYFYIKGIVDRVVSAAKVQVVLAAPSESRSAARAARKLTTLKARLFKSRVIDHKLSRVVAFGASTGGPEALRKVLTDFYSPDCAILISQHMPERFMKPFADRLSMASRYDINIAVDGETIQAGRGYVAPGDKHLEVQRQGTNLVCCVSDSETVNGHRPSVDVMYDSLAASIGNSTLGVLLTGMGDDGARGLKKLHEMGTPTIIQDKDTSAVWGMPGRAFDLGAADESLPLEEIGSALNEVLGGKSL